MPPSVLYICGVNEEEVAAPSLCLSGSELLQNGEEAIIYWGVVGKLREKLSLRYVLKGKIIDRFSPTLFHETLITRDLGPFWHCPDCGMTLEMMMNNVFS